MHLVHRKGFAAIYWLVAFVVTVAGIVLGAHLGNGSAPEFGDGTTGASAGSHLLFAVGGAIVGGLVALALFAGIWIALWAAARRAGVVPEDDDEYGGLDELDDIEDDDELEDVREHEAVQQQD